jgi:hypothetical protein
VQLVLFQAGLLALRELVRNLACSMHFRAIIFEIAALGFLLGAAMYFLGSALAVFLLKLWV